MKILVIGLKGQLARALLERGDRSGITMVAAGRPQIDLANPTGLGDLVGGMRPDLVINAAAYTAVDRAEDEPEAARAVNVSGPAALARAAAAANIPFIHVSTDYVFDGKKGALYTETDAVCPVNVYGQTKAEGEAAVRAAHPGALVARTSWVYAPEGSNFVRTMLRLGTERDRLTVVADQFGRPTEAGALADALLALGQALRSGAPGGLLHVAAEGDTSWHGFAVAVLRGAGLSTPVDAITTADFPTRAPRPADTRLDLARARQEYGVVLPHWQESLERCLAAMGAGGRRER
ncbi:MULTISPECIES: dTDP-4-dehydrorhamnose reductase [Hyphobacterium]|uniref:dTDP-4-dehydrorhamnose reductase n=1 Tax=Hyphobacterium vulgare TaxID=1736751 RepID=A0ABV6ZW63_9PROT